MGRFLYFSTNLPGVNKAEHFINTKLTERQQAGNYRQLKPESGLIDFCSNDYLGFARSAELRKLIEQELAANPATLNGSAGSRLLAGNTDYAEQLEAEIALLHGFEAGLIYNSGYDANLGLFSSLPQKGDTIITDELVHASIIDGCRLSHAERFRFKHNDLHSLEEKLQRAKGNVYIAVESIYSMDGDTAPLAAMALLTEKYGAHLIVDEAHATGVFGYGLVHRFKLQDKVFAQVVTFGKALGCHGAIVLGNNLLRNYLVNFSRPFIYTTAAPFHQLASVKMAYQLLQHNDNAHRSLHQNISYFKANFSGASHQLIPSNSAIQCIIMGSNDKAKQLSTLLQSGGYDVRPILSPTVAAGTERLRICLHAYNTDAGIAGLLNIINNFAA